MTNDQQSEFGAMFDAPMEEPRRAYIKIDFVRPDGDGIYSSVYDVCSALDIATVNKNLADGYRIVKIVVEG